MLSLRPDTYVHFRDQSDFSPKLNKQKGIRNGCYILVSNSKQKVGLQIKVTIVLAFQFLFSKLLILYSSFSVISFCLDSVLKSRDVTPPPKVHYSKGSALAKGCETWTERRKSTRELMSLNYGAGEDS